MKHHTKIYMQAFGYSEGDYIPSEISGTPAVDIHHILPRGRGGKDTKENLMALNREEHDLAEDKTYSQEYLQYIHNKFMEQNI
jgi:hypothetical protein